MSQTFRLYWLRQAACDAGTLVSAAELDPSVRERILDLTRGEDGEFLVRLPFLDRRDWCKRDAILPQIPMERAGNLIRSMLDPHGATRDAAATLVYTHPAWREAPTPASSDFQPVWQRVSLVLQKGLRQWIPAEFIRDPSRCQDRANGFTIAVYQGSRPYCGKVRGRGEFAYDMRDYPDCRNALTAAWKLTGATTKVALAAMEKILLAASLPEVARRYAPIWVEDVQRAVRKRPKRFADLLATDSTVINAVVDLGSEPTTSNAIRTARMINGALRNVLGVDMRTLGVVVLEEATRALAGIQAGQEASPSSCP